MADYIFTLTAGRTGTAWLADFLEKSTKHRCYHEHFSIDTLGNVFPDIKTMQTFNKRGNNDFVREFWRRKFASIEGRPFYCETNHTLGKCGLVENLVLSNICNASKIIILNRNLRRQCASYIVRGDFVNDTILHQWYLWPYYERNLVAPQPLAEKGRAGMALWYCYEMLARQQYYKAIYSNRVHFIEADLEDITTDSGCKSFFEKLGLSGEAINVPASNQNHVQANSELAEQIDELVTLFPCDAEAIARDALRLGRSFEF